MSQTNVVIPIKPLCAVRGMLHGGRAMCGFVIVGLKYCGLPKEKGTCDHQRVTEPGNETG